MKSFNIGENKIKICLTSDEIEVMFGSYDMIDYDSPRSRAIIDSLICSAMPKSIGEHGCDKVLIEVLPERDGCSIQVTRIYDKGIGLQKNIRKQEYILLFSSSEDLIDFIGSLKPLEVSLITSSELYRIKSSFALYLCTDKNYPFLKSACEYGKVFNKLSPMGSIISEHGKLLFNEAAEKLYKAFIKSNKTP